MKRNILRLLSISAVVVLALASCTDSALVKSEVEAGWNANSANIPTVTLGEITLEGKGQDVVITGSTISTSGELLEAGIELSTDEGFNPSQTTYIVVEDVTTFGSIVAKMGAMTTYYIRAYGVVAEGMAYSDVKSVTTKDLPLIDKVCGTFQGTVVSQAYGDSYTSQIVVEPGTTEGTVVIYNIEPYYAGKGYVKGTGFNYVEAILDEANQAVVVPYGTDMHLGGRVIAGINTADWTTATGYAHLTFVSQGGGTILFQVNGFGTMTSEGAEDNYAGAVKYTRK